MKRGGALLCPFGRKAILVLAQQGLLHEAQRGGPPDSLQPREMP